MTATAPDFIRAGMTYRQLDFAVAKGWLIPAAAPIARDRAGGAATLRRLADLVEVGS